jgi:hypothetical protein
MASNKTKERRSRPRKRLPFATTAHARGERIGLLTDLSLDGLQLESDELAEDAVEIDLTLDWPEDVVGEGLNLTVQRRWSQFDEDANCYRSGYQITQVTDEERDLIEELVGKHGYDE